MRAAACAVLALLATASLAGCLGDGTDDPFRLTPPTRPAEVAASSRGLTVDGHPFLVRGVEYSPVPPGVEPATADGYWDWVDHPEIYNVDFPLMKRMGVNTIRIVDTPGNCPPLRRMLDAAHAVDIRIIAGLRGPAGQDAADPGVRRTTLERVADVVRCARDHPATLMYLIGNEVDYNYQGKDVGDWYRLLEEAAQFAHRADPHHPVATANNALTHAVEFRDLSPSVDVYATNMYAVRRDTWRNWFYPTFHKLLPDKPILISEFGSDAWDSSIGRESPRMQADLVAMGWGEIEGQSRGGFNQSAGGVVFEWSDEWWKHGDPQHHDGTPGWAPYDGKGVLPDNAYSEEWFGLVAVDPKDPTVRIPREAYFRLQKAWGLPDLGIAPSIVGIRSGVVHGDTVRVVAQVVPLGPLNVTAKVRFRVNAGPDEVRTMVRDGDTQFSVELGPFDGMSAVFFSVVGTDSAGRTRVSEQHVARLAPHGGGGIFGPIAQVVDAVGHVVAQVFSAVRGAVGAAFPSPNHASPRAAAELLLLGLTPAAEASWRWAP